jgi:hypothetical protein
MSSRTQDPLPVVEKKRYRQCSNDEVCPGFRRLSFRLFPVRSWVDLLMRCPISRDSEAAFRLAPPSSIFPLLIFLLLVLFHEPGPDATITCPSTVDKTPNQESVHFTLTDAYPARQALSSPERGQRTSCPGWKHPYSVNRH